MKRHFFVILLLSVVLLIKTANAEEIALSYTASTLTFLAGRVANDQGFFRQEGLDVKFVQMRTVALAPALANAHIDYTMSFLPPVDSALKGIPVQMAGVFVDRSLHYLVTKSTIKSPADLRGKTFVINAVDFERLDGARVSSDDAPLRSGDQQRCEMDLGGRFAGIVRDGAARVGGCDVSRAALAAESAERGNERAVSRRRRL